MNSLKMSSKPETMNRNISKKLASETSLLGELKAEKFDLGIAEFFECFGVGEKESFLKSPGLFHLIGLENTVLTSSTLIFESLAAVVGVPESSSYVPGMVRPFEWPSN